MSQTPSQITDKLDKYQLLRLTAVIMKKIKSSGVEGTVLASTSTSTSIY